jgi:V8-like Glu-specific endopeptidase
MTMTPMRSNRPYAMALLILGLGSDRVLADERQVVSAGGNTSYTQTSRDSDASAIDFRNATPMPLPMSERLPARAEEVFRGSGVPGFEPGAPGTGVELPQRRRAADMQTEASLSPTAEDEGGVTPQEYGTSNHPFTTSRVDLLLNTPSRLYPYRAAGKLYFKIGQSTYVCSASLIKKGIIVTAAHCVAQFGASQFYSGWQFVPAQSGLLRPYGTWTVTNAWIKTSYYDGTDNCAQYGVICENDVAVLVVKPRGRLYPGRFTGYFSYGWDGYGFAPTLPATALISQLGYPVSHDRGLKMQRTDSAGYVSGLVDNTVWGGRQTGGSSGGPELVNLGIAPVLSPDVLFGSDAGFNVVVGVTSWGYIDQSVKEQGASRFTSNNIVSLVSSACGGAPAACAP